MAQRLPVPGSDNNSWGDILNGFLGVSLNTDGTIKTGLITTNEISSTAAIAKSQLASTVQASLNMADASAPLSSPAFTGTPTAPTAASGNNSTSIATTAFVQSTTSSALAATRLATLITLGQWTTAPAGTIATVGTYQMPSGGKHVRSQWVYTGSYWNVLGRIVVDDSTLSSSARGFYSDSGNSRADVTAAAYNSTLALVYQDELIDSDGSVYRFGSPSGQIRWRVWDTVWIDVSGSIGWGGATYLPSGQHRYFTRMTGGVAWIEIFSEVQNTSSDAVSMGPMLFRRGSAGKSSQPISSMFFGKGSNSWPLWADWTSADENAVTIVLKFLNTSFQLQNTSGQGGPTTWNGGYLYGALNWTPSS